ncbi:MAG TPA: response regulator transcription factor [Candidatus Eremiobacteraceae bacterium]|nr:response regulator transcription factor [Candidatus Eremiobacteraceae bacterium]
MDDHVFIRRGIRGLLSGSTDWTIAGEADNGRDAVRLTQLLKPDVILLDVNMPGMSGLDVVRAVRMQNEETRILLLTLHDAEELIRNAFKLGINGYLLKTDAEEELVRALRVVLGDGVYLSPKLNPEFVKSVVNSIVGSTSK